jgi:DNA topoisomerase-1
MRLKQVAIPPAWTDVWICPDPRGHLQATGRDAKGRKQYRYHAGFRAIREATKFERLFALAEALPRVRAHCQAALALPGLPRDKVIAAVIALLQHTLVRVGNEEYCRANQSFGLTTLRGRHARVRGSRIELRFMGKSGKACLVSVSDRRLARVVQRCQELPGEALFEYEDDEGCIHRIGSSDVNETLRAITGRDFTAKDFRTWAGTVLAAQALSEAGVADSQAACKRRVVSALGQVADRLHNTVAVCRKAYVHPQILRAYADGRVLSRSAAERHGPSSGPHTPGERAVLRLLAERSAPGLAHAA